jgi:hypothetical protein
MIGFSPEADAQRRRSSLPSSWTQVASEGGSFTLSASGKVYYGTGTTFINKDFVAGTYRCTNETFGFDPVAGKTKYCYLDRNTLGTTPPPPPPPIEWVKIADENSTFSLLNSSTIRYGANSSWIDRILNAGTQFCNNNTFGDPVFGVTKACYIDKNFLSNVGTPPPVLVAPVINSQPLSTTVVAGSSATFSVAASGDPAPSYQWRRNGTNISGATNSSYTLASATTADNGAQFSVVVSNSAGSVTSSAATLNVTSSSGGTNGTGTSGLSANLTPNVDRSLIMTPNPGSGSLLVGPTSEVAPLSDIGAFRTVCGPSHMLFDDPLVFPGQQGITHLHVFFGNTGSNYATTPASLASTGNSTCRGGIANRSSYWMPAIVDIRNGKPIAPWLMHVYYKSGYNNIPLSAINYIPNGLRFIAGNSPMTTTFVDNGYIRFQCLGSNQPYYRYIPVCSTGNELWVSLEMPNCWDGVNLDSPDHRSHMAHAWDHGGSCPASHPRPIPQITMIAVYRVTSTDSTASWRLSSDMYGLDRPGGYSLHGDLMFGWREDIMRTFIDNCTKARRDCRSHLLGDGREIYGEW